MLQWSRDHVIAETALPAPRATPIFWLQWSRDHVIAETRESPGLVISERVASMEPRSRDRGNPECGQGEDDGNTLQWSRDHVIAETSRLPNRSTPYQRLQWSRDHVIAETA